MFSQVVLRHDPSRAVHEVIEHVELASREVDLLAFVRRLSSGRVQDEITVPEDRRGQAC